MFSNYQESFTYSIFYNVTIMKWKIEKLKDVRYGGKGQDYP